MMSEHEAVSSINQLPSASSSDDKVYWEGTNDNLTEIMRNIIKHSVSKNNKNNANNGNSSKNKMPIPELLGKIYLIVSFQVSFQQLGIIKNNAAATVPNYEGRGHDYSMMMSPTVTSVQIPSLPSQRVQMIKELELMRPSSSSSSSSSSKSDNGGGSSNHLRVLVVRNRQLKQNSSIAVNHNDLLSDKPPAKAVSYLSGLKPLEQSLFYSIPLEYCDSCLYLDFITLCVSHMPYHSQQQKKNDPKTQPKKMGTNEGKPVQLLKHLEAKLLTLSMPTNQTDDAARILTEFEQNVSF
jgi:hypothetical protein